jgi:flagellar protein FliL
LQIRHRIAPHFTLLGVAGGRLLLALLYLAYILLFRSPRREENGRRQEGRAKSGDNRGGSKGGKGKIIVIAVLVLLLGGGGAGGYVFRDKIPYVNKYFGKHEAEAEESGKKKKAEVGPILPLDPFVFNLSGSQTKFAKISVAVEMKDAKVMEQAKKMIPVIRDGVLAVVGSKNPEALLDVPGRDKLKKEIQDNLKTVFNVENGVSAVYITDIVIQ